MCSAPKRILIKFIDIVRYRTIVQLIYTRSTTKCYKIAWKIFLLIQTSCTHTHHELNSRVQEIMALREHICDDFTHTHTSHRLESNLLTFLVCFFFFDSLVVCWFDPAYLQSSPFRIIFFFLFPSFFFAIATDYA